MANTGSDDDSLTSDQIQVKKDPVNGLFGDCVVLVDETNTGKSIKVNSNSEGDTIVIAENNNRNLENKPPDNSHEQDNMGSLAEVQSHDSNAAVNTRLNFENEGPLQPLLFQYEKESVIEHQIIGSSKDKCMFCDDIIEADVCCEDCGIKYCTACFQTLHPMKGPFQHHVISESTVICKQHLLRMSHFCKTCGKCICIDCAVDRLSHKSHLIENLDHYVKKKKDEVMKKLDNINIQMSSILKEMENTRDTIEFNWLYMKDRIRQEFVSMHELLIEREKCLLHEMKMEVDKSLIVLTDLDGKYTDLCVLQTEFSMASLDLVQEKSKIQFIQQKDDVQKQRLKLLEQILNFHHPDIVTSTKSLLLTPFSLYKEKSHLNEALQLKNIRNPNISVISSTVFLPFYLACEPIGPRKFWHPMKTGPSINISYKLKLYRERNPIYTGVVRYRENILNVENKPQLDLGKCYTLEVTPVYTYYTGRNSTQQCEGRCTTMIIVTGDLKISAKKLTVYLMPKSVRQPISTDTLWHLVNTNKTVNANITYRLELKGALSCTYVVKHGDTILNDEGKPYLQFGIHYYIGVTPIYTSTVDSKRHEGLQTTIPITTGDNDEQGPFSRLHVASCYENNLKSFEEQRYSDQSKTQNTVTTRISAKATTRTVQTTRISAKATTRTVQKLKQKITR